MAYLAFVFVCVVWGSTFILMERVSHVLGPVDIGIWRLFSAAAALGLIWWIKRDTYHLDRRFIPPILFSALVANVAPYVTQPYVLGQGFGHSFFGVAVAAIPLLTILWSIPMLGIWPTRRQLVGVLGGLVCLYFVVDDGFDRGMSWTILALASVVPLTGSFNNTFVKQRLSGVQSLPLTAVMLGSAGLMLLPLRFCQPAIEALDLAGPANPVFTPAMWVYMILLGVVATGISTVVFFYMVFKQGPLFAGMTTYVVPMLAFGWGLFDRESISMQQLLAMGGVLVMVGLVQTGSAGADLGAEGEPEFAGSVVPPPLGLRTDGQYAMPATLAANSLGDSSISSSVSA
jgi:drug/metabolite transporter (DMT)-like permease